jgi:flagellar hook-associated protein 1 FlgK
MPGLFDSLSMAARSLQTQQYAMNVAGQNISNVNTPGYTRRTVDFAAVPPSFGGGVEVQDVHRVRDSLLDARLLKQVPLGAYDSAVADQLSVVETNLGDAGESIDGKLNAFYNAFSDLSQNPASPVSRRQVQVAAQDLATSFNEMSDRLEASGRDADARIRATADQINTLSGQIAKLNAAIVSASTSDRTDGSSLTLQDQQEALVRQLAELADVRVITRQEGGVDVTLPNGRPLVVAANAYTLDVTSAPNGYANLSSGGVDVTAQLTGGTLGGLLHVRDTSIPSYLTALDQLAAQTAASVNGLHQSGFDLNGNAGVALFTYSTPPVGTSGAAGAIQVNSAIVSDNSLIVAAGAPQAGDNGTARAIAALRDQRVLNGTTTLSDGWGNLVYAIGGDAQGAVAARDTQQAITRQIDTLRDQVSGVSLDEEALNLLKFQRAYEANAKFFSAVDSMLDVLMNTYRG